MNKLLSAAERKLSDFNAQDVANTSWALATLRHHDGGFTSSIAQRALDCKLGAKEVSQLVLGLSSLGCDDPAFFSSVGSHLLSCSDLGLQSICNVFHGLAMVGLHPPWASELLMDRLPALMLSCGSSKQMDMLLGQAFHYMLVLEARGLLSSGIQSSEAYQQMRERCRLAWVAETSTSTISRRHREVFEVLRQLPGCSGAICEHKTEDSLFSMDIGLELPPPSSSSEGKSVKLAIEVDGPWHFMSNKPTMATGETRLRNFLLEARGWRVVSVPVGPHDPWDRLDDQSRAAYLQGLIGGAQKVVACYWMSGDARRQDPVAVSPDACPAEM